MFIPEEVLRSFFVGIIADDRRSLKRCRKAWDGRDEYQVTWYFSSTLLRD